MNILLLKVDFWVCALGDQNQLTYVEKYLLIVKSFNQGKLFISPSPTPHKKKRQNKKEIFQLVRQPPFQLSKW